MHHYLCPGTVPCIQEFCLSVTRILVLQWIGEHWPLHSACSGGAVGLGSPGCGRGHKLEDLAILAVGSHQSDRGTAVLFRESPLGQSLRSLCLEMDIGSRWPTVGLPCSNLLAKRYFSSRSAVFPLLFCCYGCHHLITPGASLSCGGHGDLALCGGSCQVILLGMASWWA